MVVVLANQPLYLGDLLIPLGPLVLDQQHVGLALGHLQVRPPLLDDGDRSVVHDLNGGHAQRPDVFHRVAGLVQAAKGEQRRGSSLDVGLSPQRCPSDHPQRACAAHQELPHPVHNVMMAHKGEQVVPTGQLHLLAGPQSLDSLIVGHDVVAKGEIPPMEESRDARLVGGIYHLPVDGSKLYVT